MAERKGRLAIQVPIFRIGFPSLKGEGDVGAYLGFTMRLFFTSFTPPTFFAMTSA